MRRSFAALLLLTAFGCCPENDLAVRTVREARILLRHPAPGDPEWDERHEKFEKNAAIVAPIVTPTTTAVPPPK